MNRLRSYRDLEGINQEDLGKLLDLSPQMISAVESGRREFLGSLEAIGYSNDRLTLPPMSEPLHRHRASTGVTAKKRAKEILRLAGELFGELSNRTDKAPRWQFERHLSTKCADDIENLAVDTRCVLEHEESGPIQNLTSAIERVGVCLVPIVGLSGIDGLSSWVKGVPVIGLCPTVPGDRFRLTIGHELGHLLMHSTKHELAESEANRFAGALLIPLSEFDAAMTDRPQLRDFIALKSTWGVSVAALVYRAHQLGYVDDGRFRALQIQMSKWRRSEPGAFEPVHGSLLGRLVEVNGGVSKVASNLGLNPGHVAELVNWNHLRLAS